MNVIIDYYIERTHLISKATPHRCYNHTSRLKKRLHFFIKKSKRNH